MPSIGTRRLDAGAGGAVMAFIVHLGQWVQVQGRACHHGKVNGVVWLNASVHAARTGLTFPWGQAGRSSHRHPAGEETPP